MTSKKALICTLAVVAIAISLFRLFYKPVEKGEVLATNASEALGLRAAEEVAHLIGHKGRVALFELELRPGQAVTAVASVEMFRKVLNKHDITVARTKEVPGGLSKLVLGGRIAHNDYVGHVEASPAVDAVVTFAGLPEFSPEELQQFQATHPPLVVVDIFGIVKGSVLPDLVDQKAVALALAPRSSVEVEQQPADAKMFERYYKIFRPSAK